MSDLPDAPMRFWMCPYPDHLNVRWDDEHAYCQTPGCVQSSEREQDRMLQFDLDSGSQASMDSVIGAFTGDTVVFGVLERGDTIQMSTTHTFENPGGSVSYRWMLTSLTFEQADQLEQHLRQLRLERENQT